MSMRATRCVEMGSGRAEASEWGGVHRVGWGHSAVTSVTAARAAWSSTMRLLGGVGGDEGLDGEVVDRSGQAAGGLVDAGDGVVGEQRVGAAGELEVVGDVVAGLGLAHGRHGVAQRDALVEGGEGAEA